MPPTRHGPKRRRQRPASDQVISGSLVAYLVDSAPRSAPGAKKVFDETGGANASGGGDAGGTGGRLLGSKETAALNGAQALAKGNLDGALDAAGKLFPGDSTIGASLQGIAALKKGDAKGAINAALSFVPIPGLKDAFGLASKLLFKS